MTTPANHWVPVLSTDSTDTSFTGKKPTATKPSGDGVIDLLSADVGESIGDQVPDFVVVKPYGTDDNDETFDMRVWGWSFNRSQSIWEPILIIEVNVQLGDLDVARPTGGTTYYDADIIVEAKGDTDTARTVSPDNNLSAYMVIDPIGSQMLEFTFDLTGAAAANALYRTV
jgi:hypothetical protein